MQKYKMTAFENDSFLNMTINWIKCVPELTALKITSLKKILENLFKCKLCYLLFIINNIWKN